MNDLIQLCPFCQPLTIFLGEEKLVAPLIAIPNVDKANRRQKERQKTKLALCVICMQNGNGKLHFCKLIGQSPSTELRYWWV